MDPKAVKLALLQTSATLAAAALSEAAQGYSSDTATKLSQLLTTFYPFVLAAWAGNGQNPDGSKNAFVDPVPATAPVTVPTPAKPAA